MTAVSDDMGPLVIVPRSHREMVKVEVDFKEHVPGSGRMHRAIRLRADESALEKSAVSVGPLDAGDVVFFHSLLVHRSGPNRSKRTRWTMNPRFSDALDPQFIERGWLAVRDKTPNMFESLYPDFVVSA